METKNEWEYDDAYTICTYSTDSFRPSSYKNNNLTWQGRRLLSYGNNTYTYNSEGIRISKTTSSGTYTYILDDNRIIKEIKPNNINVYYHYDEKGLLVGFNYNNNEYFYVRDILGNIINILDSNGNIQASYRYNAYGKIEYIDEESIIEGINSFFYKGYYYDEETCLYYCNSRYYDSNICRWISIDEISYLDSDDINCINLWCYCGNNPVMYVDNCGYSPKPWQWVLFGLGVLLIGGAITILSLGIGSSIMVGSLAGSMLHGAAVGTIIGAGIGTIGGAIIGNIIYNGNIEGIVESSMVGLGGGAILGAIVGATAGGIKYKLQQNILKCATEYYSCVDEPTELHHIVEQCQIKKSGFSSNLIRNKNNEVRIAKSSHKRISAYYSRIYKKSGLIYRNYLATKHYSIGAQYNAGIKVLKIILGEIA